MDDDDEQPPSGACSGTDAMPSNRSGLRATNAAAKSLCTWATARPRSASTLGYVMNGTHESTSDVMPSASMSLSTPSRKSRARCQAAVARVSVSD